MDPMTIALIVGGAAAIGAGQGTKTVAEQAVVDIYQGLKSLIKRKFGDHSELAKAVESVETRPDSQSRKDTLAEEIGHARAGDDGEILAKVEELKAKLEKTSQGQQLIGQINQTITGNYNVTSGTGSATLNITNPKE
jgi:phage terminase small subunit